MEIVSIKLKPGKVIVQGCKELVDSSLMVGKVFNAAPDHMDDIGKAVLFEPRYSSMLPVDGEVMRLIACNDIVAFAKVKETGNGTEQTTW